MSFFSANQFQDENEIQWDDRCHVIKLLQEQVKNLMIYKTDFEQMKKRAEMAEQLLEMRESEVKLKFDEIEETFKTLEDENNRLKMQLAKEMKRTLPEICLPENNDSQKAKENKWKLKYKALARITNGTERNDEVNIDSSSSLLKTQLEELKCENEEKSKNIRKLSEELQKASSEAKQAKEAVAKSLKHIAKLEAENNSMKQEKSKLIESKRQKAALLNHSRVQQEKTNIAHKKIETHAKDELEEQKKKYINQQSEIIRISNLLDNETKAKKAAERKIVKMKKSHDAIAHKLQEQLQSLQSNNRKLQNEINETKNGKEKIVVELDHVKNEKDELEAQLVKAEKIRKRKEKLESTVVEMQKTIEHLQSSISSVESDSSAKVEELKNLMIKHWGGTALAFDWTDCLGCIEEKFSLVNAQEKMISTMQAKLSKLKKHNKKIHSDLMQNMETLSQIQSVSNPSELYSDDTRNDPQIMVKEPNDPYKNFNLFRHALVRRMNKFYFENVSEIERLHKVITELQEQKDTPNSKSQTTKDNADDVNQEEGIYVSFRSIILLTVITKRWVLFKKEDPVDKSAILDYAPSKSRNAPSKLATLTQKVQIIINKYRQVAAQTGILTKANQELTQKLQSAESEARKCQALSEQHSQHAEDIQQENEDLKHHIDDLSHELSVTQASLKERTRELLALEREIMKTKKKVVIVKDSIPLTPQYTKAASRINEDMTPNGNFLTEAIRGGLVKMQTKILRGDEMI
ncbi:hypothetical protein TRFO_24893 [Tritrichomonas foetus]|uniref:Uncharacterized protein n=1 Tax=Tritrichomonas foetus TaxID=1144522 RepID=A0A1J4K7S5_9EUKA|nr:hypothetical protein TRFO_24893 [Tritrichomonas foetus]|eukprot:OHT06936.1 hypothetical protein TRFO_24893 [Tritrichomonas foetus]